jgi:uncharacterized membrane protein YhhN
MSMRQSSAAPGWRDKPEEPSIMTIVLSLLAVLSATLHIRAEYRGPRWQIYLFKPLTMLFILLVAILAAPFQTGSNSGFGFNSTYQALILAGLLCSLAGDIFLMLPQDRFVAGLASFLVGHLFYIAAYTGASGWRFTPLLLLVYLLYGVAVLSLLWSAIAKLRLPVLIYMAVILVMAWQAGERGLWLPSPLTLSAALGTALFVISDSVLAYDRFRRSFGAAHALVLGTYYSAQLLIAWSIG